MALEIKKDSRWWYARFRDGDRIRQLRLNVEVQGQRPASLGQEGDGAFERSRGRARAEHDRLLAEIREDRMAEKSLRRLVEIKTGRQAELPKLADLPDLWERLPRRGKPKPRWIAQCRSTLRRFVAYVQRAQPDATELVDVTPETARVFMDAEEARGVSPRTWNLSLTLLRSAFRQLHPRLPDGSNPFRGLITKAGATVNRKPFTPEELKAILEASAEDDFIRPVIVTGMCTAMRRGDCCSLRWSGVDLDQGFVTVKTSKTGETVDIPIFPLLRQELAQVRLAAGDSEFCFPAQAAMYRDNPDGITRRVKRVLARALQPPGSRPGQSRPEVPDEEVRRRGEAYLAGLPASHKAERMRQVFTLTLH